MAKLPSTFALDTGNKLNDRFFDIRWLSSSSGLPSKRWYTTDETLPGEETWGYGTVDETGHLVANYYREEAFGSLDEVVKMWFVLIDKTYIQPSHYVLLGFADDRYPWGTVLEAREAMMVVNKEYASTWAGMINWRAGDPMLQQITTAEKWRRKRISVMMFGVCDVVNACYGFSPGKVLYGGAVTTEDGEKLRTIYSGASDRITPRIGSVNELDLLMNNKII